MNNKIKKLIVTVGNICLYRNYSTFSKKSRVIVWMRILFEFSLFVGYTAINPQASVKKLVCFYMNTTGSFLTAVSSLYRRKDFKNLITHVGDTHARFEKDNNYIKKLDTTYKLAYFLIVVNLLESTSSIIFFYALYGSRFDVSLHIYCVCGLINDIRNILGCIVLYSILTVLSEQIKCISRVINKRVKDITVDYEQTDEPNTARINNVIQDEIDFDFENLTAVYTTIKGCFKLINSIFGVEITVILVITTSYSVMLLYASTDIIVHSKVPRLHAAVYIIQLLTFLMALYVLSRSVQAAQNSANELRRRLARLLIYSTDNMKVFKETKDFLRLVSCFEIKTLAFGSINIDMKLWPNFVMLFTSYTVIALQFNNVL